MTLLRRLLILPLLAPALAMLLVAVANPRPSISLRLLIWRSPPLPVGTWLMLGAGSGLALGAGASGLALLARFRRHEPWPDEPVDRRERRSDDRPRPDPPRSSAMPGRRASDPAPTVTVPFRVVQRPASRQPVAVDNDDWGETSGDTW